MRLLTIILAFFVSACALDWKDPSDFEPIKTINGIKWISINQRDGGALETFNQRSYIISDSSRLLMRFEDSGLLTLANRSHPVFIRVAPKETEFVENDLSRLRLCPMLSNWMMRATWYYWFPFDRVNGQWEQEGGDFIERDCVNIVDTQSEDWQSNQSQEVKNFCNSEDFVCFDMTKWLNEYFLQQDVNYGFILVSEFDVFIHGDRSGSLAPRIFLSNRF